MPEGDTLHRTANRLRPALEGRVLRRFEAPRLLGDRPQAGVFIEAVEAVGKHLLVHFDDGLTLQVHLRMTGSWHLYRAGERWRKPAHLLRALLEVDGWVAVCFSAPVVRTYRPDQPGGPLGTGADPVAHLGPDLCRPDPDVDECVRRLAAIAGPGAEIGPLLLDQRVACGVGNVYKSEVLFVCGVNPFAPVDRLDDHTRRRLISTANRLLCANLGTGPRTTVAGARPGAGASGTLAVYGRQRRPCGRCGTLIEMRRQGEQARSTYWCPRCQPPIPVERTTRPP